MSKAISIADLLARKDELKNRKRSRETHYIESLGDYIVIEEPTKEIALESLRMTQSITTADKADAYAVYHCVVEPNLKNAKLQEGFGCVEPTDIVGMLFKPGEIAAIGTRCLELAGYGDGLRAVDKELKN